MKKVFQYQFPLFIWALLIFWLSSIHRIPAIKFPIQLDKVAHICVFFVFCWFSRRALYFQDTIPFLRRWALPAAFLLACIYGYSDEYHQLFVHGRTYDMKDWLADSSGAALFIFLFFLTFKWRERLSARTLKAFN
jgi:VanZ family protein